MGKETKDAIHDQILTYEEVRARLGTGTAYLLLGNGFSIACDPIFRYESLYEAAVQAGLSSRAQKLFQKVGTNNFEGIMRLLADSHWVAKTYRLVHGNQSKMLDDLEVIKKTLVKAIASSHLEHPGEILDERKQAAAEFVKPFKIVYTTNYDLLLYWVNMVAADPPPFDDCFRGDEDDPDAPHLVFSRRLGGKKGILYLHGALHMYLEEGELRKHSWTRTGFRITDQVQEGLEKGQYPLFVSEGTPQKKLEQIQANGYLWYCLEKFRSIESPLVVFGHSLSQTDGHIVNAITTNPKLPALYIGMHGETNSPTNVETRNTAQRMIARRAGYRRPTKPLQIFFYQSDSVSVWGY